MRAVHRSVFSPVLAAMLRAGRVTGSGPDSETIDARQFDANGSEIVASQSVEPQRSSIERGLYWYGHRSLPGQAV